MTAMKFATKAIHKTAPPLYNPRFYKETPLPAELHSLPSSHTTTAACKSHPTTAKKSATKSTHKTVPPLYKETHCQLSCIACQ